MYGGMLLPNIFLYSLFLIKLHPFPFVLLKYFALNSSVPGSGFSFFQKRSLPYQFFSIFPFKKSIDFGTSRTNNTVEKQPESSQSGF